MAALACAASMQVEMLTSRFGPNASRLGPIVANGRKADVHISERPPLGYAKSQGKFLPPRPESTFTT